MIKRVSIRLSLLLLLSTGCTTITSPSVLAPSPTPEIRSVVSPSPTHIAFTSQTASTATVPLPLCQIIDKAGKLNVLSDDVFFAYSSEDELNQALANTYPQWAIYQENVPWNEEPEKLGKIVQEASFQETFALNPEVTLVTLGESFQWQLTVDKDIFEHSLTIGERLVRLWDEFSHPDNQAIRSQFREVSNGATYALYAFFEFDKGELQNWCNSYQSLFGTLPMQR